MLALIVRSRSLVAVLLLALLVPYTFAAQATEPTAGNRSPAGNPDLGILIILGAIGFFIFLAWIFSRMGDDGGRGPDRTLL